MAKNLLEIMSADDRKRMLERFNARTSNRGGTRNKISSEMYLLAEFGLMFGWQAVMDVRENRITLEEMFALIEAGHKVQSVHMVEQGKMTTTAVATPFSKSPKTTFAKGMRKFIEGTKR